MTTNTGNLTKLCWKSSKPTITSATQQGSGDVAPIELIDIEVVKIILDDANWIHPEYAEWEEFITRVFRFKYRNGRGETLTVFFNSFELTELLAGGEFSDTSAEIIGDMVVYQLVGDFWCPSSPTKPIDDAAAVFSATPEGQVVTQFFSAPPVGLMEWK